MVKSMINWKYASIPLSRRSTEIRLVPSCKAFSSWWRMYDGVWEGGGGGPICFPWEITKTYGHLLRSFGRNICITTPTFVFELKQVIFSRGTFSSWLGHDVNRQVVDETKVQLSSSFSTVPPVTSARKKAATVVVSFRSGKAFRAVLYWSRSIEISSMRAPRSLGITMQ